MRRARQTSTPVLYDAHGRSIPMDTLRRKVRGQARALLTGFAGANKQDIADWAFLPVEINTILRNDLARLRARSRDLARNDDTAKRFLALLKQNVLGHACITLEAEDDAIEREWNLFGKKRRAAGGWVSPSACGTLSLREISWLALLSRAIDGECFLQILRGYPHNPHRFALRFLDPDLLHTNYTTTLPNGNRVEMGVELDEFDRPVAYHFSETRKLRPGAKRPAPIPVDQIIHVYRREFPGQLRGIPDFAVIMHKNKMLSGVHEAVVVGWRVAAAKMGFFSSEDPNFIADGEDGQDSFDPQTIDATPGTFDRIPYGTKLETFDPDYPSATYESGHKTFMQQISNGLNVSSPSLSNNYSDVNYSSLRQAILEDREGWRCIQAEMIDGFYQPVYDEWYEWSTGVTGRLSGSSDPEVKWQPRGWAWIDPVKEVSAQVIAIKNHLRTRQSIIAETSSSNFKDTAAALGDERKLLLSLELLDQLEKGTVSGRKNP